MYPSRLNGKGLEVDVLQGLRLEEKDSLDGATWCWTGASVSPGFPQRHLVGLGRGEQVDEATPIALEEANLPKPEQTELDFAKPHQAPTSKALGRHLESWPSRGMSHSGPSLANCSKGEVPDFRGGPMNLPHDRLHFFDVSLLDGKHLLAKAR